MSATSASMSRVPSSNGSIRRGSSGSVTGSWRRFVTVLPCSACIRASGLATGRVETVAVSRGATVRSSTTRAA